MRSNVTEIEYDEKARLYPGLTHPDSDPPVELHLITEEDAAETDEPEDEAPDEDAPIEGVEQEASLACARIRSLLGTPLWDGKAERLPTCHLSRLRHPPALHPAERPKGRAPAAFTGHPGRSAMRAKATSTCRRCA